MLWSLLRAELGPAGLAEDVADEDPDWDDDQDDEPQPEETASARVYNFLVLPWHFEKLCIYGFAICLDSFLYLFTLLPLKGFQQLLLMGARALGLVGRRRPPRAARPVSVVSPASSAAAASASPRKVPRPPSSPPPTAAATPISARRSAGGPAPGSRRALDLRQRRLWRFSRIVVLAVGTFALCFVDMSRVYHYIRGQSVLKLYVIFNMLQICDRMFASFGEDILEALYLGGRRGQGWILHLVAACVYVFLHGLLLFCQVITLNVSVNSNNNSIFIVLVSNNFVELKQCVFKRFKEANLFQVTCSDVVERFQLFLFLVVVMIQNLSHVGLQEAPNWLSFAVSVFASVLGSEIVVDWVKHGFIIKFNNMPPRVYRVFHELLCLDFCHSYQTAASRLLLRPSPDSPRARRRLQRPMPHYSSISRRFGFSSFPMVCLFLRAVALCYSGSSGSTGLKLGLLASCWLVCLLLKLLLSVWLLGHSAAFPGSLELSAASLQPPPVRPSRRARFSAKIKSESAEDDDGSGMKTEPATADHGENELRHRLVRFSSDASAQEIVRLAAYNLHARGGVSIDFSSKRESFSLKEPVNRYDMHGSKIY